MLGLRIALIVVCSGISQGIADIQTISSCSPTPFAITDARGRITSPNYPGKYRSSQNCKWRITSSKSIRLTLEALDNAEQFIAGKNCNDYLRFASIGKDGVPKYLDTEGELCANDVSELRRTVFTATKDSEENVTVEISFISDISDEGKGFSVYFETLCNRTLSGKSGAITSLNYPQRYPNFADCFTEINGPPGSSIEIEFKTMQFYNIPYCDSDYIQINAGPPGAYGSKRTRFCTDTTKLVQIASSHVTVHLVTDNHHREKGFYATWRAVFPTTAAPTTTPLTTSTLPEITTTTTTTTTISSATTTSTTTVEITTIARISDVVISNCSYTIGGFLCQRWDVDSPHVPTILPNENDRDHNFCRITPTGVQRPWCYTTDPRKEWQYCNVSNCVKPITAGPSSIPQVTTTPGSALSTTKNGSSLGRKDKSSAGESSPVLWYPILAALALLFIICIGLFFWCRGRKKKDTARINESATSDVVSFHRFADDEYRPRENTYVEIPFLEEVREDHATRVNREGRRDISGKAFVRLDNGRGSRNSSTPSIDSILTAKESARQNFERGASTSNDVNAYSVAEDIQHTQAAPSLPKQRESALRLQSDATEQQPTLQNVYAAIDAQAIVPNEMEYNIPSSSQSMRSSTESSDLQEQSSKKRGFWKKNSKNKQRTINGFSNPIYRKESSVDSDSLGRNPFDLDGPDSAYESPVQRIQSISRQSEEGADFDEAANIYNAPSVIPQVTETDPTRHDLRVALETTQSPDSPYMMPKLSQNDKIPADEAMISITPNLIDDTDHMADDRLQNLCAVTDPISPTFDLSQDFTYDAPQQRKTTQSSTSVKSDISSNAENLVFFNQRDSGNASLSTAGQDDDKSNEYCFMGEADKPTPTLTSTLDPNDMDFKNSSRASQLYLSMRGFEEDGRTTSESSVTGSSELGRTNL